MSPLSRTLTPLTRTMHLRPTLRLTPTLTRSFHPSPTTPYASPKGKMELYSDESGSTGAGIDDVSKTDAAYDTSKGPEEAAKGIEKEVSRHILSLSSRTFPCRPIPHPPTSWRIHLRSTRSINQVELILTHPRPPPNFTLAQTQTDWKRFHPTFPCQQRVLGG